MDYLEKGKLLKSNHYCALLERLKEEITRKRPYLLKDKSIILPDNAPAKKSIKTNRNRREASKCWKIVVLSVSSKKKIMLKNEKKSAQNILFFYLFLWTC